jgi:tripartite motif-containing protein 71
MLKSMLLNSFTYHCICTTIFLGYCGSIVYGEPYKFEKGWGSYEIESGNAYNPIAIDLNRRFVYMCGYNVIQKCDMNGNFVLEWGGKGALNGQFHNPEAMAVDSDGNVYVADTFNHRIQKFDGMGNFLTKWGSEGTQPGQFNRPSGIKIDSAGIVYVVDTFNHRIQTFDGNGVFLSQWGRLGLDDMNLQFPEGIALGRDDTIYIADTSSQQIKKFTKNGSLISVIANKGTGDGAVSWPQDLEVDGAGNLFVVDSSNYRVQKFDRAGMFVAKWGGQGQGLGRFNYPQRVAIDQNDDVYVTDPALGTRVQHFNNNGDFIKTWGSYGAKGNFLYAPSRIATDSSNHSYIVESGFNAFLKYDASGTLLKKVGFLNAWNRNTAEVKPMGISVDSEGNVFVLDSYNHRVQKFDKEGAFVLQWGAPGSGDGELKDPCDLAIDSADNVYILDKENNRVQKFDKNGQFILKWGNWETLGFPRGLGIDSQDRVYVAAGSHRILKFDSMGKLLLTWGRKGSGDGEFGYLNGIGIDKDNFVYVVDEGNHRIQKFDSSGTFVNKWGKLGKGDGEFYILDDVAIDGLGNILVLDSQNARVKKFSQVEFLISGFVKDQRGFAVEGATVTLTGHFDAKFITGPDGSYVFQGLPKGDYTVTSDEVGIEFSPVSYTYSNLDNDKTNQIFQWSRDIVPADIMPIAERTADSISWVWKDNSVKETGYRLWSALNAPTLLASLPANAVSWKQEGLSPNTGYQMFVDVYNDTISTRSALSPIVFTAANPPNDLKISRQYKLYLQLSFNQNNNPPETTYVLEADKGDGEGFKPLYSILNEKQLTVLTSPTILPNLNYKFRVKAKNQEGHLTDPSHVIEFSTFEHFTKNYYGLDVETDTEGASFVAGYEEVISSLGPINRNGWLAKYDSSQVLVSSVVVPGTWFNGIARDTEGDLFVVGGKEDGLDSDLYFARYSPSLVLVSSETISGDPYGEEEANKIEISPQGDLVILGRRTLTKRAIGWMARLGKDFKIKNDTFFWDPYIQHSLHDLGFDTQGNIYVAGVQGDMSYQKGFVAKYSAELIKQTWNSFWSSANLDGKQYGRSQVEFSNKGEPYVSFDYSKNGEYSQIRVLKLNTDLTLQKFVKFDTDVTQSTIHDLKISPDEDLYLAAGFRKEGSNSAGWVGRFSPSLIFHSSTTFSGTTSMGINVASGLKITDNALYTVGTLTTPSATLATLTRTPLEKNKPIEPITPPLAPAHLIIDKIFSTRLSSSWGPSPEATSYSIKVINRYSSKSEVTVLVSTSTTLESLTPNTYYTVEVKACNSAGCSSYSTIETYTSAAVPELSTTSVQTTSIGLKIDTNGNPKGTIYELQQAERPEGPFVKKEPTDVTEGIIDHLNPETSYSYRVYAKNLDGSLTGPSSVLTVKTGFAARLISKSIDRISNRSVGASWDIVAPGSSFKLVASTRSVNPLESFVRVQEVSEPKGELTELDPNTRYNLFVQNCDGDRCSDFVDLGVTTTLANVPSLMVVKSGQNNPALRIQPNGNPAGTFYVVEKSEDKGMTFVSMYEGTDPGVDLSDLPAGKIFHFRVTAGNLDGLFTSTSEVIPYESSHHSIEQTRAYPVPFRSGPGTKFLTFDSFPPDSTIDIYNLNGEKVKTITPSENSCQWDVRNQEGEEVASGVYYVRVSGSGGDKTFKIVVQR